jgi:hypothetical protein
MKKVAAVFFTIALLNFGLLLSVGSVMSAQEGYEFDHYMAITEPTIDGSWTEDDEWTDVDVEHQMDGDLNVGFRTNWLMSSETGYSGIPVFWIIEFYDDNTEDAGDYWQICYDGQATGGSAPAEDDVRIDFVGHDQSGLTVYRGDGSEWVETTELTWGESIEIADSISASPTNSTPHYIVEIVVDHQLINSGPDQCLKVAAYDESNSEAGEQAWPDSSSGVPEEWGQTWSIMETIPEGFGVEAVLLLSTVVAAVSFGLFCKRPNRKNNNKTK